MAKRTNEFSEFFSGDKEKAFLLKTAPEITYRKRREDEGQRQKFAKKTSDILSNELIQPVIPVLKK